MSSYQGKRVLVVGGATGMGAAAAQKLAAQGAEVIVLDVAEVSFPVARSLRVDLRDKSSVDQVVAALNDPIDAVLSCAGVADGTPGLMLINVISQRYLIERLVDKGLLGQGSAIGMISSLAGLGWEQALPRLKVFLTIPDWEGQVRWVEANRTDDRTTNADGYRFSKQAVSAWVAMQAFPLLAKGIRINAIQPGSTDTPLARANADVWLAFATDYRKAAGVTHLQPEQMADVLIFLCSPAASGVTGQNLLVDQGFIATQTTGSLPG